MTPGQTLARLEQQTYDHGIPLPEVDTYIANQLQVPTDYYFAYLLVCGAIEAHQATPPPVGHGYVAPNADQRPRSA